MRVRYLLLLPLLWLSLSAFFPLPFILAASVMGAATGGSGLQPDPRGDILGFTPRHQPFVKPHQILFGQSTSRTELAWALVPLDPYQRQQALLRMRGGYDPSDTIFAVAMLSDGTYVYVYPRDVIWQ